MLISPMFLPARMPDESDSLYVARALQPARVFAPGSHIPEGSYPVSLQLQWHGGTHLHAGEGGEAMPVRAIADGEVVFCREPARPNDDAQHPLNYNPYGDAPGWTDDGMLVLKHVTDIGDGEHAQAIEFYSVYVHLARIAPSAKKAGRHIYRKDEIAVAGRIYDAHDHLHVEIICDDRNLQKLAGRCSGELNLDADGRTDALYGEAYFYLPAETPVYGTQPLPQYARAMTARHAPHHGHHAASAHHDELEPVATIRHDVIVGLRHVAGDGRPEQRGDIVLTTYRLDGSIVGAPCHEGGGAEYALYKAALDISHAYPEGGRPTPSAVYELLRFGRVIGPDPLSPPDVPHWRKIRHARGEGWVNLNGPRVTKFSDADFPHWKGWRFVQDDSDGDSRCNSPQLIGLITALGLEGTAASSTLQSLCERWQVEASQIRRLAKLVSQKLWTEAPVHREALSWLGDPKVQAALRKTVCKCPSEWNRDDIGKRWQWLKEHPEFGFEREDDWEKFKRHVEALTVPAASLPEVMRKPHWHFHPQSFIEQFRRCGWLSEREFVQMVPSHAIRTHRHNHRTEMLWEGISGRNVNERENPILANHRVPLNRMLRKYGINTPVRQASLFGNALQETRWLASLAEGRGRDTWYAPWFGRGFLQLTNPNNYCKYWEWRGRTIDKALVVKLADAYRKAHRYHNNVHLRDINFPALTPKLIDWRADLQGSTAPFPSAEQQFAPSDSAGFYWAFVDMARYADEDHVLERHLVRTDHGSKVYYRSTAFWHASAAVNLPGHIHNTHYAGINGFDSRCCAYGTALAALTEMRFPNAHGDLVLWFPEGYKRRR